MSEPTTEPIPDPTVEPPAELPAPAPEPTEAPLYELRVAEALGAPDPEIDRRLHDAGFSAEQAQLVYDLAAEYLLPLVEATAGDLEAERDTERLVRHFGGRSGWETVSRQLRDWSRANLPPAAAEALAQTYEGCLAMHRMMTSPEPGLLPGAGDRGEATLDGLKSMMRDPRYWRERDPSFVQRVTDGFRRHYGG